MRVLREFLILGCTASGGPIAHLAWFERTFVERLGWISHHELADLIALCQGLPGPASSQVSLLLFILLVVPLMALTACLYTFLLT